MPQPFSRTLRSLSADSRTTTLIWIISALALLLVWTGWFFFASITRYEDSDLLTAVGRGDIEAEFSSDAMRTIRPGQHAFITLSPLDAPNMADAETETLDAVVSKVPSRHGDRPGIVRFFLTDYPTFPLASGEELNGKVAVAIGTVSPLQAGHAGQRLVHRIRQNPPESTTVRSASQVMRFFSKDNRSFLVPEVVQTSAMDCGPVALKCLLEGFGVNVSYGRLREACQTDVDGTSINTLEDVARQLGLDAVQVMLPKDHLLLPDSATLPAIVVIRLPNGLTHFVVAWRIHGPFIQIMDPGTGRRWMRTSRFLSELYLHEHPVPAQDWREWAGSDEMLGPLRTQLLVAGVGEENADQLIQEALQDPDWHSLAALDAAVRLTHSLLRSHGVEQGEEAEKILRTFYQETIQARTDSLPGFSVIPPPFWQVCPFDDGDPDSPPMLVLTGAVLVRVQGPLASRSGAEADTELEEPVEEASDPDDTAQTLSPELAAALEEAPSRPEKELFRLLRSDELLSPLMLFFALIMAGLGVTTEAMLFRGVLDIGLQLDKLYERWFALTALLLFLVGMLMLELAISAATLRLGRRFETRLRVAFLEKIPRLGDRYLHSRLISDMTQRAHDLRELRTLPQLLSRITMTFFCILLTVAGIILLIPQCALMAIFATVLCLCATFAVQPLLIEKDLRVRTHIGALSRYYLDALLGLLPIRTHRAERAFRRGHESLLVEWGRASLDYLRSATLLQAFVALVWTGFAIWLVNAYMEGGGEASGVLLLFYWALNLPVLGKSLAEMAQQYPLLRNRILRLLEPLNAPEESDFAESSPDDPAPAEHPQATAISLEQVCVQAGGQIILENVSWQHRTGRASCHCGPLGRRKVQFRGVVPRLASPGFRPAAG